MGFDGQIADLAARQEGAFSYEQALGLGASDTMIATRMGSGRWQRIEKGVFTVSGSQDSWLRRLFVATLSAGPRSAVSHRAAAEYLGMARFHRPVELTTPRPRRYRTFVATVHTSKRLGPIDITAVDALPVTTPARTLIDLGAVAHPERVEDALDAALRDGLLALEELKDRLAALRKRGRRGAGVMARILKLREPGPGPESRYERIYLRAIENAGLPTPQLQVEIHEGNRFLGRVDAAWPDRRLAIEIDGHRFHATRDQRAHDALRENAIKLAGWQVLRFTTDQVWEHRQWVVQVTARALGRGNDLFL